jgi:N-methylhydantoinase A/oxoprolinase/acetone carboxylase beta subunit
LSFDIGGTFTDFVLQDLATGRIFYWKSLSTPLEPARGALEGLTELLADRRASASDLREVLHATTVGSNAIIEKKGAQVALVTTDGFKDMLQIGREKRYETYDLSIEKPPQLVERHNIVEALERIDPNGDVVTALGTSSLHDVVRSLQKLNEVEAIAIVLLHSYANPAHELRIKEAVRAQMPNVALSASSEVSPSRGEYERGSTTVADAYIKPVVAEYVETLTSALRVRGFTGKVFVMQSNGGLSTPEIIKEHPIRIVESGPAAGVLMAAKVAVRSGRENALTFDMGGTTTKIGAIDAGQPATSDSFEVDGIDHKRGSGLPLNVPAIELVEIGAGGGSIAAPQFGATIRIGPESAGSEPGPACYGRGGTAPTVTDANLVLGYLDPDYFLGGNLKLDHEAAHNAIERFIAEPIGINVSRGAWGVHAVANATMERALRVISIERGRDPRGCCLVAFGGAGPLHAARLARALAIPTVLIPPGAGLGSAVGLLEGEMKFDLTLTRPTVVDEFIGPIIASQIALLRRGVTRAYGLTDSASLLWSYDVRVRYSGQGDVLKVVIPDKIDADTAGRELRRQFETVYERTYGYIDRDSMIEIIDWNARVVVAPRYEGASARRARSRASQGGARKTDRLAYSPEARGHILTSVWDRYSLSPGEHIFGPAIIEERESTLVLPQGDSLTVDPDENLVVRIGSGL